MATKAPLKATRGATTLQQLNVAFPRLGEFATILRNTHVGYFYNKSWSTFQL